MDETKREESRWRSQSALVLDAKISLVCTHQLMINCIVPSTLLAPAYAQTYETYAQTTDK